MNRRETTAKQTPDAYIKEFIIALSLIAFGMTLCAYADDISAGFGNMVQETFNNVFTQAQD